MAVFTIFELDCLKLEVPAVFIRVLEKVCVGRGEKRYDILSTFKRGNMSPRHSTFDTHEQNCEREIPLDTYV